MKLPGNIMSLIVAIIVVIVIYLLYTYFTSKSANLTGLLSGKEQKVIKGSTLPTNSGSANYTYSIWFYVNEWSYRMNDSKVLLSRGTEAQSPDLMSTGNPRITLAPYENNLEINVDSYAGGPTTSQSTSPPCIIRNFPLQRWVNLIISLNGRTLDVYVDGKLVRTCVLPGVPRVDHNADIHVTPGGGFSGWTSNIQYIAHPSNPQEAYNIYKEGPGTSSLLGLFEKYKIKISYLVNNQEKASVQI